MSKVLVNETSLIGIADAIRGKNGTSATYKPAEMAAAITNLPTGGGGDVEPIVLTGNQPYACSGDIASTYIKLFGDTITTNNLQGTGNMFENSPLTRIPFSINYDNATHRPMSRMFTNCHNLVEVPEMNNVYPESCQSLFEGCYSLRYLPENFGADWNWSRMQSHGYAYLNNLLTRCYSLREIPDSLMSNLWGNQTSSYYMFYYNGFMYCYALDEVRGMPVQPTTLTSNCFSGFLSSCHRLKSFTFETKEDGTPKTANWKSQTIDLTNNNYPVGYANVVSNITGYNSNITADKEVKDDVTYQALKNNPDWFTAKAEYSRYNHDSAVETINSLPDTTSSGGTNTIKFRGGSGSLTDGGAIDTLTEAEIAVAAAKGWTVTLV